MPGFLITGNEKQYDSRDGSSGRPRANAETARSHRWEVAIYGFSQSNTNTISASSINEIMFYAKSVTRPTIETDKITLHHRSNEMYLPGKSRPGQCTLTLYERVENLDVTAQMIRNWWSSWMSTARTYSLNLNNNSINGCKCQMGITLLDGNGLIKWTYVLKGVFPIKVEPSELDYSNSDISTLQVTLSLDSFEEQEPQ